MRYNDKIKNHMKIDTTYTTAEKKLADIIFKISKIISSKILAKQDQDRLSRGG